MASSAPTMMERLERARELMAGEGVHLLLIWPSADLVYLTGYAGHASERPKFLALGADGARVMLAPQLEAPGMENLVGIQIRAYGETEDPFSLISDLFESTRRKVAVSDQMWAGVLLQLQRTYPEAFYAPASPLTRQLRIRKSREELDLLVRAGAKADAALDRIVQLRFAGRTEREIADQLDSLLRDQGLEAADWGPIVASGPNAASPHHITGDRQIHEGDAVVLDFGGSLQGYQADITRTIHVGSPSDEFRHVYEVVRQAQEAGFQAVGMGVTAESVDRASRGVIDAAGYGDFFVHRTGHGIGLEVHEEPYIVEGNNLTLEPGMCFSVEPGVYLPGRFGVRIEDSVALTERGPTRLNNARRELTVVH